MNISAEGQREQAGAWGHFSKHGTTRDKQFGGDFHKFYFDHVAFEEPLHGEAKTSEWRRQVSILIYEMAPEEKSG